MDGADNTRSFKSGGLPRHSFIEDPFFQATTDMFRDFDNSSSRNPRHFGSNPRLFDDNFFENFSRGNDPFGDGFFLRSSLPRRPMNNDGRFYNQHFRQQSEPQRSPSQPPSSNASQQNVHGGAPAPTQDSRFPGGNLYNHQRQSSSGSNYDNFSPATHSTSPSYKDMPQKQQSEKVHVIPVRHESTQKQQQPRDHHASNSDIVEINSTGFNGYTNGQLNPDRRSRPLNVNNETIKPSTTNATIPTVYVEEYENGKDDAVRVNAISDTPIPLPPPAQVEESSDQNNSSKDAQTENKHKSDEHEEVVRYVAPNPSINDNLKNTELPFSTTKTPPNSVMGGSDSTQTIVNTMIQHVDELERRVEQFRERAAQLEQDKDLILDMLDNISKNAEFLKLGEGDQEDLTLRTKHLLKRCRTVNIEVSTPRNEEQTRALATVNTLINNVVENTRNNIGYLRQKIERFLNACNPDEPSGPIDEQFQARIVECTADDQKKIRRRLAQLIEQMQRAECNSSNAE